MRRRVPKSLLLAVLATLGLSGAAALEETRNQRRLEEMPLEHRQSLTRTLDHFDLLPAQDQREIRQVDAQVGKLDTLAQARYRAVMRRYHVWLQGLSEPQKGQLEKASSVDAKIALVEKWKKAERLANANGKRNLVLGVHPGDLGIAGPFEIANAMKVWMILDEKERARIEAITPVRKRLGELIATGQAQRLIKFKRFLPAEEEKLRARIDAMDQAKDVFKNQQITKKAGAAGVGDRVHHLAESLYFMDHPPVAVNRAHLSQFEAELPAWFRSSLVPLSPEDAKRRLTILYRQIYEPPNEIKASRKPDAAKPAEKVKTPANKGTGAFVPL